MAQPFPIFENIFYHHFAVFIAIILRHRNIIFDSFNILPGIIGISRHWYDIHVMIIYLALFRICESLRLGRGFCLNQSHLFSDFLVPICRHHIRVKAQDIFIPDAVCNAIPVKFIAKYIRRCAHFTLIFIMDRSAGKAKE